VRPTLCSHDGLPLLPPPRGRRERLGALDPEEVLARHVAAATRRLLRAASGTDHATVDAQVALTNRGPMGRAP
jgi:hypothetical protein